MNSSLRIILALALPLSAAGAFIACGGDEGGDDDDTGTEMPPATGGNGGLTIAFNPMYSAFEETHTYQVPAVVDGLPAGVEWSANPADAVSIQKSAEGAALFTMLKSGEVTITAKTPDGKSGTAKLTISPATPQEWELGSKRYNSMQGAIRRTDAGMFGFGLDPNASCTNCHGEGSPLMVEHTPQQTAGYSAEELIKVFTEAQKPEGVGQRTDIPEQAWKAFHKWQMSEEEQRAIIVYLRSLTPKPTNSDIDFGRAIRGLLGDAGIRFPSRDGGRPVITPRSDAGAAAPDAGASGTTTPVTGGLDAGT